MYQVTYLPLEEFILDKFFDKTDFTKKIPLYHPLALSFNLWKLNVKDQPCKNRFRLKVINETPKIVISYETINFRHQFLKNDLSAICFLLNFTCPNFLFKN